jgi:multidrug resistance efflux pump
MSSSVRPEDSRNAIDLHHEDRFWEKFVGARTADEFCRAWLGLLCGNLPGVRAAAVLVESADAQAFVPIAAWPEPAPDLSHLGTVVGKALGERRGIVQPGATAKEATLIAYPVFVEQRIMGTVAMDLLCTPDQVQIALRQIHWGSAWLSGLFSRREWEDAVQGKDRIASVMEAIAVALRQGHFQQVLFEVSNDLRQRFSCSRVAIGLVDNASVKLAALSEAAHFEKSTPLVKACIHAMEEAYDEGGFVHQQLSPTAAEDGSLPQSHPAHLSLLQQSDANAVLSCPLMHGAYCVGIVTLEKADDTDFSVADQSWLNAYAALLAPIVEQRRDAERNSWSRFLQELRALQKRLFGPRYLVWKAAAILLFLAFSLLALVHLDYRVSAKTVIEGEVQQVAAAPFEGFIGASYVRAGDIVRKGQPLAQMDDHDLVVERVRWTSERDQYDNKLREAMANHDLTAVQVVGAQVRQAEAQLALVTEKIARAQLKAPYDGVVVSGDLSQQIGSPVETGKKLFEIAPLQSYRVILQVDEREIRHVRLGQKGQLVISGIASDPMSLSVAKVTSVATAQDGKNFFRVEARLQHAPESLRPGMEGVGKIEVGSRSLWWILTHSFTDWLRLTLWTWTL